MTIIARCPIPPSLDNNMIWSYGFILYDNIPSRSLLLKGDLELYEKYTFDKADRGGWVNSDPFSSGTFWVASLN